jgi:hypothetical protein
MRDRPPRRQPSPFEPARERASSDSEEWEWVDLGLFVAEGLWWCVGWWYVWSAALESAVDGSAFASLMITCVLGPFLFEVKEVRESVARNLPYWHLPVLCVVAVQRFLEIGAGRCVLMCFGLVSSVGVAIASITRGATHGRGKRWMAGMLLGLVLSNIAWWAIPGANPLSYSTGDALVSALVGLGATIAFWCEDRWHQWHLGTLSRPRTWTRENLTRLSDFPSCSRHTPSLYAVGGPAFGCAVFVALWLGISGSAISRWSDVDPVHGGLAPALAIVLGRFILRAVGSTDVLVLTSAVAGLGMPMTQGGAQLPVAVLFFICFPAVWLELASIAQRSADQGTIARFFAAALTTLIVLFFASMDAAQGSPMAVRMFDTHTAERVVMVIPCLGGAVGIVTVRMIESMGCRMPDDATEEAMMLRPEIPRKAPRFAATRLLGAIVACAIVGATIGRASRAVHTLPAASGLACALHVHNYGEHRLDEMAADVGHCDTVALFALSGHQLVYGCRDIPELLVERLGYRAVVSTSPTAPFGGVAILTRLVADGESTLDYPNGDEGGMGVKIWAGNWTFAAGQLGGPWHSSEQRARWDAFAANANATVTFDNDRKETRWNNSTLVTRNATSSVPSHPGAISIERSGLPPVVIALGASLLALTPCIAKLVSRQ